MRFACVLTMSVRETRFGMCGCTLACHHFVFLFARSCALTFLRMREVTETVSFMFCVAAGKAQLGSLIAR